MSKRFQTVGSLLRPETLLEYKRAIEARDDIRYPFYDDFPGYEATERAATEQIVQEQIAAGLSIITDGEYSKSLWHLDFVWGLGGVTRYIAEHGYFFQDTDGESQYETRRDIGLKITEPLSGRNHHFIQSFKLLQELAGDHPTKLCIPAPAHIFGELSWSENVGQEDSYYANTDELKQDIIRAYKEFVDDYAAAGGRILQLDDCLWELFAEDNPHSPYAGETFSQEAAEQLAAEFVEINNAIIDHVHGHGLLAWTHNCRGNYDSRNMGAGSYAKIAEQILKPLRYDRFFLEWDDDRAGSLEALQVFADRPDVEIVLGLLSSKTSTLDDETRVVSLLDEAAQIIDKDRLYLSHQCGFASTDNGNELSPDEQWAKIRQGQQIAADYWGV